MINKINIPQGHKSYNVFLDILLNHVNKIDKSDVELKCKVHLDTYFEVHERLDKSSLFVNMLNEWNKEIPITIVGDYDCDGILGSSILISSLTLLGYKVNTITPDRFKDGYGMKVKHIKDIHNEMIITVDNGITALEAVSVAKENGNVVIVTDHHLPKEELPIADLIIDPWANDDDFKSISGGIVAFKLMYQLFESKNMVNEYKYFLYKIASYAGVTTMSDMMPVIKENRLLIRSTLDFINYELMQTLGGETTTFGLIADSFSFYRYRPREFDEDGCEIIQDNEYKVATKTSLDFGLIPTINSVNRVVGDCLSIVKEMTFAILCKKTFSEVSFTEINNRRKHMMKELLEFYTSTDSPVSVEALNFVTLEQDYGGIVGLVASDIVNREQRPAIIGILRAGDYLKCSGRSYGGFKLNEALDRLAKERPELDFSFGGHSEALGCEIKVEQIEEFRNEISRIYSEYEVPEEVYWNLNAEDVWAWSMVYKNFQPFGMGFEMPKFYAKATIIYIDKGTDLFSFKTDPKSKSFFKAVCYDTMTKEYIKTLYYKGKGLEIDREAEMIVSFMPNDSGEIVCKIDSLFSQNDTVMDLAIENRAKYLEKYKESEAEDDNGFAIDKGD